MTTKELDNKTEASCVTLNNMSSCVDDCSHVQTITNCVAGLQNVVYDFLGDKTTFDTSRLVGRKSLIFQKSLCDPEL